MKYIIALGELILCFGIGIVLGLTYLYAKGGY